MVAAIAVADWVATYADANEAMKGALSVWHGGTLVEGLERQVSSAPTTYLEVLGK